MKVHVPVHLTPDWIGSELSRLIQAREAGRKARTTYIRPKHISIREHIALADKLNQNHESI